MNLNGEGTLLRKTILDGNSIDSIMTNTALVFFVKKGIQKVSGANTNTLPV